MFIKVKYLKQNDKMYNIRIMILFFLFLLIFFFMAFQYIVNFHKIIYLKTVDNNFRFSNSENKFEK
jgi:hypothetical protein